MHWSSMELLESNNLLAGWSGFELRSTPLQSKKITRLCVWRLCTTLCTMLCTMLCPTFCTTLCIEDSVYRVSIYGGSLYEGSVYEGSAYGSSTYGGSAR